MNDLRHAWRLLSTHRTTSVLMLLTLALGLGANITILSIARGVFLRALPYRDPDSLVMIWQQRESVGSARTERGVLAADEYHAIAARQQAFAAVAAVESSSGNLSARFDLGLDDGAERLRGAYATTNLFDTLGVGTAIGRTFAADDPADVAIISDALWRRLFAAAPTIVGRRLELASGRSRERAVRAVTVIGVLPPRVQFTYPDGIDLWLPLLPERLDNLATQSGVIYSVVARLRPGIDGARVSGELTAAKAAIAAAEKRPSQRAFWAEPVHENAVGSTRPAMQLLSSVAVLVFLVACLNVAVLMLAQTCDRRRAIAVQVALGASRARIVRQLFVESALLAGTAAIVVVMLIANLHPLLRALMPALMPRTEEIGVDLFTLGASTALVVLAIVLSTAIPAWRGSPVEVSAELAASTRASTAAPGSAAWRHLLIGAQTAVVCVLLVGAGLLLHSFWKLQRVDPGFDGERVFTAELRLLDPKYFEPSRLTSFQEELLARVRALPGVERASITSSVPLRGVDWMRVLAHRGQQLTARLREVDPEYFAVMGIPLRAGRSFTDADGQSTRVTILVDAAAYVAAAGGVLIVMLFACLAPALRVSQLAPTVALRWE